MACALQRVGELRALPPEQAGTVVPVILDRGDRASVAGVAMSREPRVGDRFEYHGVVWEITRSKDHARGWVARPVAERTDTL